MMVFGDRDGFEIQIVFMNFGFGFLCNSAVIVFTQNWTQSRVSLLVH